MWAFHRWREAAVSALALLCAAGSAYAETWKQVADAPIAGLESCVDTDAIGAGPDGRTEFRFAFCGLTQGVQTYQVDCRQTTASWSTYNPDKSTWAVLEEVRDGALHETRVAGGAPVAEGAKWVCEHR